jgi:hypothetical protein
MHENMRIIEQISRFLAASLFEFTDPKKQCVVQYLKSKL